MVQSANPAMDEESICNRCGGTDQSLPFEIQAQTSHRRLRSAIKYASAHINLANYDDGDRDLEREVIRAIADLREEPDQQDLASDIEMAWPQTTADILPEIQVSAVQLPPGENAFRPVGEWLFPF